MEEMVPDPLVFRDNNIIIKYNNMHTCRQMSWWCTSFLIEPWILSKQCSDIWM